MPDDVLPPAEPLPHLDICAPFAGLVLALEEVPDPVFAQAMVGPGLALAPLAGVDIVDVGAPIPGTIATLLPHAFAIEHSSGRSALIHLGIDTVELKGIGFMSLAAAGDHIEVAQRIMTWAPEQIQERGFSTITPVIALQADAFDVESLVAPGDAVRAGQPLLRWS